MLASMNYSLMHSNFIDDGQAQTATSISCSPRDDGLAYSSGGFTGLDLVLLARMVCEDANNFTSAHAHKSIFLAPY